MEKPAKTEHPILSLIAKRWSPRAFADKPVSGETLLSLFEAARWAPSSSNLQPWSFIIAQKEKPEEFNRMADCLAPSNQRWARQVPVLVVAVAKMTLKRADQVKPNRHAFYDTGQALALLSVQATEMGLFVHQMGGFDVAKTKETFHLPDDHEAAVMFAVGYAGDPETLPEDLKVRELEPRQRKPLSEFVFSGDWGKTAKL